jgi:MFS family permease
MWAPRLAALRHRDFALFVGAQFLWTVGLQIQAVALGWQIYALTDSPFQLGLVGLMEFLPTALLAFATGPIADRFDRRRVLLIGAGGELAVAVVLVSLAAADSITEGAILALAFAFGVARAVATPAARALMPNLLPHDHFASAVAWNSTSWQVATIGGPALGGLLYAISPVAAYGGTTIAMFGAVIAVIIMRGRPVTRSGGRIDLASVAAGFTLIFRNKLLLGAISLDLFAVIFSGAAALLPVFAKDILMVGPEGLGILRSAPGLGAVIAGAVLTQRPLRRGVGRTLFFAVGLFGVAAIVFGLSRDFWLSWAALLVLGCADMVSVYVRSTLVPLATPDAVRGRVLAVETVFIGASNELGSFVAGSAAALLGPVIAVLAGGSLTLAVAVLWTRLFPTLRDVDRMELGAPGFPPAPAADKVAASP